jgi:glycosyltransferase involved in cell wall biosynthesis
MKELEIRSSVACPNIAPFISESVLAYQEAGYLDKFYTTFFNHKDYPLTRTLIKLFPQLEKDFKRRDINEIEYALISGKPFKELLRVFSARKLNPIITDKIWEWSELNFDKWVASKLHPQLTSIHTYEHAALSTLKRAKQLGITSFYEQPSQHHALFRSIVQEQIKKYPEFNTNQIKLLYDAKSVRRNFRRDEELKICDFILCNSTFTKNSLISAGITEEKIITIPYGFPETSPTLEQTPQSDKVIFMNAGNHNLRKGIHLLYGAWKACDFRDKAELWMIGKNQLPNYFLKGLPENIKFIPNIPRTELMELYSKANVFILPTLADGFGMVISEAMSKGVPVITTYNSGGPDIIEDKKNGLLIPPNDIEAISSALKWSVENKHRLAEMGIRAYEKASSYPWSTFRKNLTSKIQEKILEKK